MGPLGARLADLKFAILVFWQPNLLEVLPSGAGILCSQWAAQPQHKNMVKMETAGISPN